MRIYEVIVKKRRLCVSSISELMDVVPEEAHSSSKKDQHSGDEIICQRKVSYYPTTQT